MNTDVTKPIFVFGSNLAGRHGKGAASIARLQYGAIYGQGEGLQGQSYAVPTKDAALKVLPLRTIKMHVDKFLKFAERNSDITFKVTALGTGLAGYSHDDIGPMFALASMNCVLPMAWKPYAMDCGYRQWWWS
jgi:hypothetical protein